MTGLVARIVDLENARSENDCIVNVYDTADKLICWCGPYTRAAALAAKDLFENGRDFYNRANERKAS